LFLFFSTAAVLTFVSLINFLGDVKIFDFGLAKELDPTKSNADGMYLLTADTGSPRYMAPEVASGKPYNELADVYSFSILLWQILSLETPFEGYTMTMFQKKVVQGGARPVCNTKWPVSIQDLMKRGWAAPKNRPSMSEVGECLRDEMHRYGDDGDISNGDNMLDASRKSELSLRGNRQQSMISARSLMANRGDKESSC
jgi:serine/threonine protein kinase